MIFLNINCWFGKCLKSDVCTDSFPFFCSHAALSLSLPTGVQPPLHLKFQLSVLANKLRIWSHSSTFYTLHCVFLRYCLSILRSCFLCLIEILYELLYFAWLMTVTYVFSSLVLLITALQLIQFKFCSFDFFGAFGISYSRILRFHLNWSWLKLLQWTLSLYSIHYT